MLKQQGITLLEVLASIFVIAIGLLGVLAVIPFGTLQVSRAYEAEYASNMLANAAEEIVIRDKAKPTEWGFAPNTLPSYDFSGTAPADVLWSVETINITHADDDTPGTQTTTTTITEAKISVQIRPRIRSYERPVLMDVDYQIVVHWDEEIVKTFPDNPSYNDTVVSPRSETLSGTFLALNCTRFLWFEPREAELRTFSHVFPLATFEPADSRKEFIKNNKWVERMRGRDDLLFTLDDKERPVFTGQYVDMPSSGKYTWFFTFQPQPPSPWSGERIRRTDRFGRSFSINFGTMRWDLNWSSTVQPNAPPDWTTPDPSNGTLTETSTTTLRFSDWGGTRAVVAISRINRFAGMDILACHNRFSEDDVHVVIPSDGDRFTPSLSGGRITFPDDTHLELLTQTKYVFVTWGTNTAAHGGDWYKIVFLDKDERSASREPSIVVTGNAPLPTSNDIHVYIPSGVLYRKQVQNIPIR